MSLRIWLPLTKDLRNQGLDDVTVTNNGATFNSAGKLGGCYSFGTGNSYIIVDSAPLKTFTEFSFACWVKIISWNTNYSTIFAAKNSTGVSWNNLIFSLLRDSSTSALCFNISNGSSYTATSCRTETLSLNTWYHIACTYKNGQIKLYQDGNVVSIYNTNVIPNFNSIVNLWIGKSNENSYQSNNLLNDVRIYDHALSSLEVKHIAQGLILHYPLNRGGWGQENLLKNSQGIIVDKTGNTSGSGTEYYAWDVGDSYTNITTNTVVTISFDLEMYVNDLTTYGGQLQVYNTNNKGPVQISGISYIFKNKYAIGETINERVSLTTTLIPRSDANKTNNYIEFYTGYGSDNFYKISNVKLELGSIATPWCPNSSDVLATTIGLNDNIEYDTSGYGNNGAKTGTFSWTSNTPKYAVSQVFNGTNNAIQTPSLPSMISDKNYTIAVWIYKTVIGSKSYQTIYGGPSGFEIEARNGGANETKFVPWNWGKPMASYELNEWNHCVFVHSDSDCKIYLNGEYIATGSAKASNPSGNYFVGAWNTATQQNFDGLMSDFRIYATALSADDVKSLYNNLAYIDNQGNIYGAVYEEV